MATRLDTPGLQVPRKLALVMGREADGVSAEMLAAAHRWAQVHVLSSACAWRGLEGGRAAHRHACGRSGLVP
mgnify:CR=1 FL=1